MDLRQTSNFTPKRLRLLTAGMDSVDLEDHYRGCSLFLCLSGPSLARVNFEDLQARGIVTMAVNNGWTLFRPNIWTCVDPPHTFHDQGWLDPGILKLVPAPLVNHNLHTKTEDGFRVRQECPADCPNTLFYLRNSDFDPETFFTEGSVNWGSSPSKSDASGIRDHRSVMLAAIRLAVYLGFKKIYLLGCDFKMDPENRYAFKEEKSESSAKGNNKSYEAMSKRLEELKPKLENLGVQIINCTDGSGLKLFEYMPLELAIDEETLASDALDSEGWYNRERGTGEGRPIEERRHFEKQKYEKIYKEDEISYGHTNHGRFAYDLVKSMNPKSIVDVGCGHNEFVSAMLDKIPNLIAIGVDFACPGADIQAPAHDIPVPSESTDVVTCFDMLEHLVPDDVDNVLKEFKRIGKKYVFSISYRKSKYRNMKLHPTVRTEAWWVRKLREHGYTVNIDPRGYLWGDMHGGSSCP